MTFSGGFGRVFRPIFDLGLAADNGLLNALIAYWKMDEAAGANDALDVHTNGLTMTQNGSPGSAAGKIGTARTLASASLQSFTRTDDTFLSTGDVDFTIAGWVYLDNVTHNGTLFSKYTTIGNLREYLLYYNYNDHVPNSRFTFAVSSNGTAITAIDATTFGAPLATNWCHVIGWHDAANNQIGIAVNGVVDTASYSGGVYNSTANSNIGRLLTASPFYTLNGRIDEIAFWKSAAGGGGVLTAAQRTALYNSGAGLAYAQFTT